MDLIYGNTKFGLDQQEDKHKREDRKKVTCPADHVFHQA